jgi:hypothetical protein
MKPTKTRWTEHVERIGAKRKACRVLVGKPEGKRPIRRPRRRWEDNIKMDLREIGWIRFIWFSIGAVEGSCEHGNEPSGDIKCEVLE